MIKTFKWIFFILIVFIQYMHIYSQQLAIDKADTYIGIRDYKNAIPILKKLSLYKNSELCQYKLGYCYIKMRDFKRADSTFTMIMNVPGIDYYLLYGEVKQTMGKYDEAITLYEKYKLEGGQDSIIDSRINSCRYAKDHQDSALWHIQPNPYFLNGIYTGGCFHNNLLWFGFKSSMAEDAEHLRVQHTIFTSSADKFFTEYTPNDHLLKSKYYIGGIALSKTTNDVIYSQQDSEVEKTNDKNLDKHQISTEYINTLNLYYGIFDGAIIAEVQPFPFNSKEYSCMHPSISESGNLCYFSSDMPGGSGGFDIYKIEKSNGVWSNPIHLGDEINTLGDEMYPVEYHDSILFFSSNGLLGYGGADIFKCNVFNDRVSKPANIGLPANSSYDDFGINFITDRNGYFFSNRASNANADGLYTFAFPIEMNYDTVKGHITDALTLQPLINVTVTVMAPDSSITHFRTDKKGNFTFDKMIPNSIYTIVSKKELYHETKIDVASITNGTINIEMELDPIIAINNIFTLDNILFEYRHYDLTDEDMVILDNVAKVLIKNPNAVFELSAHTDARGDDQDNMILSDNRAKSTVTYLVSKGVHTDQLVPVGHGETMIKNKCKNGIECTDEEHHINRRVEIKVLKAN